MGLDLKPYIEKGISFEQYLSDVQQDIETQNNTTGKLEHIELNDKRMKRLYKTIQLSDVQKQTLAALDNETILLIITEGWCGDASQILPLVNKVVDATDKIDAKIVYRDQNLDLIEEYNTNGTHSIPIIVGVDKATLKPKFRFGPRPAFLNPIVEKFKADRVAYPKEQFHKDIQLAYNKDKGQQIFEELVNLIKTS